MASDAGKTVIAFFVLAIILCIVNILVAFCIGCKGKSSKLFLAIYPLQTVAVIVGVVAYAVVSDVNNYEDMEGVTADNNDYHDFEIKEGLGLAIANCLLSLIVLLISCLLGKW